MPRCARAVSLTGYYHVYDRGNSKQIIFEDDSDRYRFLSDISDRFARHKVAVLAWCLMDNHFHLMVDDPYDNLSRAMQCALTAYAKYFNGKTGRTDHLFDNRYSRVAVESDTQAVQLLDYIHLNPVKGAIDSLEAYRWSSFRAYQLGYDPFDICDAAPMLDIVGGGGLVAIASILRKLPGGSGQLRFFRVDGFPTRMPLPSHARPCRALILRCSRPCLTPNVMRVC